MVNSISQYSIGTSPALRSALNNSHDMFKAGIASSTLEALKSNTKSISNWTLDAGNTYIESEVKK